MLQEGSIQQWQRPWEGSMEGRDLSRLDGASDAGRERAWEGDPRRRDQARFQTGKGGGGGGLPKTG